VSKQGESDDSKEGEEEYSDESEVEVEGSWKSDEEAEEDAGEMACAGGCKGKWSRYSFEELDWNQDPLAEDVCGTHSGCLFWSVPARAPRLTVCLCSQVLCIVFNVAIGLTMAVWGEQLWITRCVRDDVNTTNA
jgi:hypothetical protein